MKKQIVATLLAGMAATGVYAQGIINLDNINNANSSPTATSGGLVFRTTTQGAVVLEASDISVELFGGASAASLSPIVTLTGPSAVGISGAGAGYILDPSGGTYTVNGVAGGGIATLELQAWEGNFSSYAAAVAGGAEVGSVTFQNPTGGGGTPASPPTDLTGMPALVLGTPEPSTIALGGLGAAALMFFRRRNK
jgi:hypothetical protein